MAQLYRAHRKFALLARQPDLVARFRLHTGELIAFDNRRILHAPEACDPAGGGRHLRGYYLDGEVLFSRIRPLEGRL